MRPVTVDKAWIFAALAGGAFRILGQVSATANEPALAEWANISAVGALIYLLFHTLTRTIPKIVKDQRDDREAAFESIAADRKLDRAERAADRDVYRTELAEIRKSITCQYQHPHGGK